MQKIANLLVVKDGQVLLLKKPRRGWYVAPGGKIDEGESIYEAAIREFVEETGARPINPHLKGVYTMMIMDDEGEALLNEWLLFTFISHDYSGELLETTVEGELEWHPIESLHTLPMAEGDRSNLLFAIHHEGTQYGTFYYTEQFRLLRESLQQSMEGE
ncbi:8-oxo-dGTP diphosphatase [Sporosarcina newyorkensis]|uniref:8-oxo-dGTP diphosphatase n=1 Tax=Sporosarcina newyorkensis TaxID=759851 RepID=A0A1T4YI93_9BACL|nr:8-oxo-dGTP diphosphatase [Sporosarcina newyorkensis]SKB01258.1 8-oxo-dGTP diphosphatase [Sporosarcina newyorkensis]